MKKLKELVQGIPCTIEGSAEMEIKGIAYHSGRVEPGFLFVAVEGFRVSGARYIDEAVNRGAVAIATTDIRNVTKGWVTAVVTKTPRRFLAQVSNRFHDFPARKIDLVGITGTNGKTTTGYLVRAIARSLGIEPGFVGTVEYWDGEQGRKAIQTTPESLEFVEMLSRMVANDVKLCVAEVSSHALELDRVSDLDFKVGVFTNLTQDHLDFHKTLKAYEEAKLKLFTELPPTSSAVVNLDDRLGWEIAKRTRGRVISYGTIANVDSPPDLLGEVTGIGPRGLDVVVTHRGKAWPVGLKLAGRHNLMNLMAAFGAGLGLGWDPERIALGAETLENVPGRLERIETDRGFQVYVDYAHTPDALNRVLATVREFTEGRVIAVFGCGGDRDQGKRPLMGRAVATHADLAVVTSDNPRSEDPDRIIREIVGGMNGSSPVVEPDRAAAIRAALRSARAGDTVVVAGKGHEEYQIVGTERRDFDDREEVRSALAELG